MKTSSTLLLVATLAVAVALKTKQVLGPASDFDSVEETIKTFSSQAQPKLGAAPPPGPPKPWQTSAPSTCTAKGIRTCTKPCPGTCDFTCTLTGQNLTCSVPGNEAVYYCTTGSCTASCAQSGVGSDCIGNCEATCEATSHFGVATFPYINPSTQAIEPQPMFKPQPLTTKETQVMLYVANFMMGLNADSIAANTSQCFYRITNSTFVDVPRFIYNMTSFFNIKSLSTAYLLLYMLPNFPSGVPNSKATPANQMLATNTFSLYVTVLLQNLTNNAWVCNNMIENLYMYIERRAKQYSSWQEFGTSFFQNAIASSFTLTKILQGLTAKQSTVPTDPTIFFDIGRIIRLLITFQPISAKGLEQSKPISLLDSLQAQPNVQVTPKIRAVTPPPPPPPAPAVFPPYMMFFTAGGLVDVLSGFALGANIAQDPTNPNSCIGGFTTLETQTQAAFAYFNSSQAKAISTSEIYRTLLTIDKFLGVVYVAGGLSTNCFKGLFTAQASLMQYTKFVTKPKILYLNLIYNFGLIYESIKAIIFFFVYPYQNTLKTALQFGQALGSIFYNIFST